MNKKNIIHFLLLSVGIIVASCGGNKPAVTGESESAKVGPMFIADSAMAFCQAQCDFGPRTMNSEAHDRCAQWIVEKFETYGLQVEQQKADLTGWDGKTLHSNNIIAHFNTEAERRILICAHWDSRPWADNDPDSTNWKKPVLAANDAASGVGVMLELARLLQNDTTVAIGIDFVCFDAEDYGVPQWAEGSVENGEDTWALGAQHFAEKYSAGILSGSVHQYEYGVLLDMVGGQGSRFYQEGLSVHYAGSIVDRIWACAEDAGEGSFFPKKGGFTVTDDHKPLNEAGIRTADIIAYFPDCQQSSFGPTWHTVIDDMEHMDPSVIQAVGQTLVQLIFTAF